MRKTVLCFGDSNTWGAVPGVDARFSKTERWTGILASMLSDECDLIEEGQSGRTTVHDDPFHKQKNALPYLLPCLESHQPDVVVLMLGTNDLKRYFALSAYDIAQGAARLVKEISSFVSAGGRQPTVLLVSPPAVKEVGPFIEVLKGAGEKSRQLPEQFARVAEELKCEYFDASRYVESSDVDGVHWEPLMHQCFAEGIYKAIQRVL